jgi:predicted TIM-barrel fold metal-dependent hydrolase
VTALTTTARTRVFDADNHYWETSDAFTRHRDPRFADRGVRLVEVDGQARYFFGDRPHPIVPGPGDVQLRPKPGALYDYFAGRSEKEALASDLASEIPSEHPEWYNRDARLKQMDEQGIDAVWMFPSHGVTMEGDMLPDIEASVEIFRAFNRWLDEDWGFAYQDRLFAVPFLTLSNLQAACAEVEWCAARGAKVITIRNGPAFTAEGFVSPADPRFDPFWARVQEAGLVVAPHAGFNDGYQKVDEAVADAWGYRTATATEGLKSSALNHTEPFVQTMMKHRLIHDFSCAVVAHGLFERFPRLRFAYIEHGGTWVPSALHLLKLLGGQHPGMFKSPPVEQFIEHCWVAPFVEDSVEELAHHLPVDRILFGSDWPHAEGLAVPRDFYNGLHNFSEADQARIMHDNTWQLTFGK